MNDISNLKVGFIGAGKMGGALLEAAAKCIAREQLFFTNPGLERRKEVAEKTGAAPLSSNLSLAEECGVIFLGVKPNIVPGVLEEIRPALKAGQILVSMAAGLSVKQIETWIGKSGLSVIRIMPNLPAMYGEGMIALSCADSDTDAAETVETLLSKAGRVERVSESLMDVVTGVSGSGPAYAFMFIEAMADAAVLLGMRRPQAYVYAAQTLRGAATMVLEGGAGGEAANPAVLKDAVCSPAGTTIEGVAALEEAGFRAAVIRAVKAAAAKSAAMGKKN